MSLSAWVDGAAVRLFRAPELGYPVAVSALLGHVPMHFDVERRSVEVALAPPLEQVENSTSIGWTAGTFAGELMLPTRTIRDVLRSVEPLLHELPVSAVSALLLELALAGPLSRLEAALGETVRLVDVKQAAPAPDQLRVGLDCAYDGEPFAGCLLLPHDAVPVLQRLARQRRTGPTVEPPLVLAVRLGLARLDLTTLRSLAPGDAVLVERPAEGRAAIVVGERRVALGHLTGTKLTLEAAPQPARAIGLEDWTMADDPLGGIDPEDASLDELRITLVFELGRKTATLAEVRGLAKGHVIELGPLAEQQVSVLANGRRIGQGELVQVGEAMAVRLTRLAPG